MNHWEMEKAFMRITDILPTMAQAQKDYYNELIKSGFEEEHAIYLAGELLRLLIGGER